MDSVERVLISFCGSFFGFLLGLVSMRVKDRLDRIGRIRAMCVGTTLMAQQLGEVLHEDPKMNSWLKVESLFQFFDLLNEPFAPKAELQDLVRIYSQWTRGFFLAGGLKASLCNATKSDLLRIADRAEVLRNGTKVSFRLAWCRRCCCTVDRAD